ncbi:DUF4258 domain-containing protein [Marinilabilia salmonicolor]|uniref:Uncharacterized protein n=1 Tax=Marinilabilia salmonicolor TaxID=989 RepID=A0A368UT44_9BACT|nr:DUF4258 domain-containing protein [Marinilabilia salmonicolor]RCW31952.1 hypothetical protein DFO77_11619 [Marinilabilia salmonicolor]
MTGDPGTAWDMAVNGAIAGGIAGGAFGGYKGYRDAKALGNNPWTGKAVNPNTTNTTNSTSLHAAKRAIERNVNQNNINDALKNPIKVSDVKIDQLRRPSVKYIGKGATVIINPETGKVITVYPTSTQRLNSILKIKN